MGETVSNYSKNENVKKYVYDKLLGGIVILTEETTSARQTIAASVKRDAGDNFSTEKGKLYAGQLGDLGVHKVPGLDGSLVGVNTFDVKYKDKSGREATASKFIVTLRDQTGDYQLWLDLKDTHSLALARAISSAKPGQDIDIGVYGKLVQNKVSGEVYAEHKTYAKVNGTKADWLPDNHFNAMVAQRKELTEKLVKSFNEENEASITKLSEIKDEDEKKNLRAKLESRMVKWHVATVIEPMVALFKEQKQEVPSEQSDSDPEFSGVSGASDPDDMAADSGVLGADLSDEDFQGLSTVDQRSAKSSGPGM